MALTAVTLFLSACGGVGGNGTGVGPEIGHNDIAPRQPEHLVDGGELRWPVSSFPDNFNYLHVDGNERGVYEIVAAILPTPVRFAADGSVQPNPDYVESLELTGRDPQVVTYRLNPRARWSDGTPVTWRDFRSQWLAMRGTDAAFRIVAANGYERIGDIARGVDDFEVRMTFTERFADWKAVFDVLYPQRMTSDPNLFNVGWKNQVPVTAGPFRVERIDRTAKTVALARDPNWWGERPRLERIFFRTVPPDAQVDALANGELDFADIGDDVNAFQRASGLPRVEIRRASAPHIRQITFNGGRGSVLADQELRLALQRAIDRRAITSALVGRIDPGARPLGNHIYGREMRYYRDNSQIVAFDPEAAMQKLDELGWRRDGDVRRKDGRELRIRDVVPARKPSSEQEAKLVQQQLGRIGVRVDIVRVPGDDFFDKYVNVGDFDITHFGWVGTSFPISSKASIYRVQDQVRQNYGRIGNETINQLFDAASRELDEQRAAELANRIDEEIWRSGHSLVTYQRPDVVAVRRGLSNLGARGFMNPPLYTRIGYVQG
ncbi:hypothetical protein GCM10012275_11140 [Longimycelium tulufanense]|uniref:Solute-binding protein family 5 domain-containing protein n=1 Tax=Longimycelium tulufanense TaxID=907463 RepID=A0A8J3C6R1_9PSEU|nr:hypothetical protein GCM10012275_11140 [Longimycelium tulufanense]